MDNVSLAQIEMVTMGDLFRKEIRHFPAKDKQAIFKFIQHLKTNKTFDGLEGLNKESHNVNTNDPNYFEKVKYAIDNHLWHYHIGIPAYSLNKPFGQRTSEYVLHYQLLETEVRIVDYSAHPPFKQPIPNYLIYTQEEK